MLPILVIWDVSDNPPSHIWELTNETSLLVELKGLILPIFKEEKYEGYDALSILAVLEYAYMLKAELRLEGKSLYNVILKNIPIITANGILLLLSVVSSDILTFISININKNRIDTAPTYTNK